MGEAYSHLRLPSDENESCRPYRPKRLKTGPWTGGYYIAGPARRKADRRRAKPRKRHRLSCERLWARVDEWPGRGWSPPPISGRPRVQFDAAWSPDVAATKAKGNDVAGHVNVFVFPDLCSGNIGYKAVQRSSGALAIGPVLQGLNKPVNDLSRGATVQDIINTIALTAIEAQ